MSRKIAWSNDSLRKAAPYPPKVWVLIAFLMVGGCATYHPMPLTPETVQAGLKPPDMNEVRLQAGKIKHPLLKPVLFDDRDGLSPDEAAILAVIVNPTLRAVRDQQGIASAQLLQAGILPNPQLLYVTDVPAAGGVTSDTNTAFDFGLSWQVTSLISRQAHIDAAQAKLQSVNLGIAWQEWQVAEAARLAVYRVLVLEQQYKLAGEAVRRLDENRLLFERAVNAGLATELQQSAAETAFYQARHRQLEFNRLLEKKRSRLKQLIGLPADADIKAQPTALPNHLRVKSAEVLAGNVTHTRLDVLGLERGYASEEASVRAAILAQFPKISIGFGYARDTTNVYSIGLDVSIGLPIFNRNQGRIALERATRQQLFDKYVSRIFKAQSEVARLVMQIDATNRLIANSKDALYPLQRLVATYRQAIKRGQADILSYYIAWKKLTNQRIKLLSFKRRLVELRIALELASGSYEVTENRREETRQ